MLSTPLSSIYDTHLVHYWYMNHALENHRFFPVVAWLLVIGFATFTYLLTTHLQKELSTIGGSVEQLEQRLNEMEQKQIKR